MNTTIRTRPHQTCSWLAACVPLLACMLLLGSCINLQHVSDYATASGTQLENYNSLGYSFSQACTDACNINSLRDGKLDTPPCACAADSTADSVTTVLYKTLHTYFEALAKLSDKGTGHYKMTGLSKGLQAGSFGSVTISAVQADASTKLAGLLTDLIAGSKKQKKVKEYIGRADSSVQVLLGALAANLRDNLGGKLRVQQAYLQGLYTDLASDPKATQWERVRAIQDYRAAMQTAKTKSAALDLYAKALDKLAQGHHKLYLDKEKLTLDECKAALDTYSSQLNDLGDAFKKLKNSN